jgi:hypothetical protein
MPITAMSAPARRDGKFVGDAIAEEPVAELIQQAGRAAGLLALREAQLAAVVHGSQLRRAAVDVAVALGSALAFLTAFVLANWAAVSALSGPLSGWAALLVLAAAWIVIGIVLLVLVPNRADVVQKISAREQARDEAEQRLRESLERLAGGVGNQAAVRLSAEVGSVAGGVVRAGEHIIDRIDELTDDLGKAVPGGGVVNWVADKALVPGRHFASAARTALEGLGKA